MKAFKAFIKPFEAPQRCVKIKFKLIFSVRPGSERKGLNMQCGLTSSMTWKKKELKLTRRIVAVNVTYNAYLFKFLKVIDVWTRNHWQKLDIIPFCKSSITRLIRIQLGFHWLDCRVCLYLQPIISKLVLKLEVLGGYSPIQ